MNDKTKVAINLDSETRLLAAIAYGESSTKDVYEEMAALASVMVRQRKARGYKTIDEFTRTDRQFSFVVSDGNLRFKLLMKATEADIEKRSAMRDAVKAARNALDGGVDYSNGAFFWDGADIKTNFKNHYKVTHGGVHVTDPKHNIYGIPNIDEVQILYKNMRKRVQGKEVQAREEVGRFTYAYESTAAHGGTIFWKLNADYLKVTRGKEYK